MPTDNRWGYTPTLYETEADAQAAAGYGFRDRVVRVEITEVLR